MKIIKSIARTAAALLCPMVLASFALAATNPPIVLPRGLAVDSKGNLWVVNSGANNILSYNLSTFAPEPAKTITVGITNPWGVAVDRWGHIWVSNLGTAFVASTVTEYAVGVRNPLATLTNEIANPEALAFDPVGDLWVQTNFAQATPNFKVFTPPSGESLGPPANLATTVTPGGTLYGFAFGATGIMIGSPTGAIVGSAGPALLFGQLNGSLGVPYSTGFAIASDASGKFYVANLDGSVQIVTLSQAINGVGSATPSLFLQLPFAPSGIAIDNVRGRIYFSNYNSNSISVYSTAGTLLHVIQ
jgi:DNA-binding beta-propeller fold protein YncE